METLTRIKICGITNRADAEAAVEYGADALGFIFVPGTPRYVGHDPDALTIPLHLPPFVTTVAVYRNAGDIGTTSELNRHDRGMLFQTSQFYEYTDPFVPPRNRWIKASRIKDAESLKEIETFLSKGHPQALLLDAHHPSKLGGAGVTFNWELAVEARARFDLPLILAGGLTPDNVGEAIRTVRPYAVDVSSGVEAAPGRKDLVKLRAFIEAVRAA